MISDAEIRPLLEWYNANKRILPWRDHKDPYRIWVSEIMLQQTRVEAVKPYYDRFLTALPTIEDLARVEQEQLLKLWEGLGYYNRVRNMQKAAQIMMDQYQGKMPMEYEQILQLPGIGSYTAGAIISIAFDKAYPAVDGNVLRILTRLTADKSDILNQKFKKQVEQALLEKMPQDRPGDFNQAMMELGATVCLPNGSPKCDVCPWAKMCLARKYNLVDQIPYKEKKQKRVIEKKTVLIIRDGERTYIQKRPDKGLLAGLYEFPSLVGWVKKEEIEKYVIELGFEPLYIERVEDAKHIFSHREWHMRGYVIRVADTKLEGNRTEEIKGMFFPKEIEQSYPIPSAFRVFTRYINIVLGKDQFLR